jgi:hypothetical protein
LQLSLAITLAALLAASPQKPAGKAAALPTPRPDAVGGSCCAVPGKGGSCAQAYPGHEPHAWSTDLPVFNSDEEWLAYVANRFAEPREEPPDADPFAFSVYRGQRPEPMGSQTLINGARMAVASLLVEDPPHVVEKFYHEAFLRMGMVPINGDVPQEPGMRYVSFRPPGSSNLKTVTLVPRGHGSIILASVGNPEELLTPRTGLPDDVPLPPRAEAPTVIQQLETGMSARSAFFKVPGTSAQQVRDFYRRELSRQGFTPTESGEADNYERPGLLLSISAVSHTEPGAAGVSLVWFEEPETP